MGLYQQTVSSNEQNTLPVVKNMEYTEKEILEMIEHGLETWKYDAWAEDGSKAVRVKLAELGYFSSEVLYDDPEVWRAAMEACSTDEHLYQKMEDLIDDEVELPCELIQMHIENDRRHVTNPKWRPEHLYVKLESLQRELTLLEKTMNLGQLYMTGSPMWCKYLTFIDTFMAIRELGNYEEDGKLTVDVAEEVISSLAEN